MLRLGMKQAGWFLFLLLIPTQLGKYFWPEWSLVSGVRSDYLSPTLYLIDLVWAGLLVVSCQLSDVRRVLKNKENILKKILRADTSVRPYIAWGGVIILNILLAGNPWVAVYRWGRIIQWIVTVWMVMKNKDGHTGLPVQKMLMWIIPIWIGGESLLATAQVIRGKSLQGIFYWLGERRFELTTPGIAQIAVVGRNFIRGYGTFSHPNSLAGFLLVAWMWWRGQTHPAYGHPPLTRRVIWWVVNWLAILGMILAGSRVVWGILIFLGIKFIVVKFKERWGYMVVFMGVVLLILGLVGHNYRISDFVGGWDKESFSKRWELNIAAVKMIKDNPLLGVGAGNFVSELPKINMGWGAINWWQPVHNIFLLAVSEIGIVGTILLVVSCQMSDTRKILKNKENILKKILKGRMTIRPYIIWGIILITGMVDHYWLTLPQNTWLLAIMVGINSNPSVRNRGHLPLTREVIKKKIAQ